MGGKSSVDSSAYLPRLAPVSCVDDRAGDRIAFQRSSSPTLIQLRIDVKISKHAGVYLTTARVSCCKDGCGQDIELVSDGRDTAQHLHCPKHGEVAIFKNFADYTKALKVTINHKNAANGLPKIDANAEGQFEQDN